jgi:hypothetical protein
MRLALAGLALLLLGACGLSFPELVDPGEADGGAVIDAAGPDAGAVEDGG